MGSGGSRGAGWVCSFIAREVVLAIQDTTAINYNGLEATRGLVGLGGPGKGVKGLMPTSVTTHRRARRKAAVGWMASSAPGNWRPPVAKPA